MIFSLYLQYTSVTAVNTNLFLDPLEQFDVLSLSLPFIGGGLTNLSLLLAFNTVVISL